MIERKKSTLYIRHVEVCIIASYISCCREKFIIIWRTSSWVRFYLLRFKKKIIVVEVLCNLVFINFDNVNWRPWRVSKLTFRALALRQSDPGTQVFGLLIVKFECLSITHGLFSANRNNDVLILHVSNLTNTLVFQHHLLTLSFFMAKIND